jgi:hypothetical protein
VSFDRAAQVQLLAEAAGTPAYRFSFEILWDDIVHSKPDLLDECVRDLDISHRST